MKYKIVLIFMSIITYFCSQTSTIAQTDNDLFDELSTTAQNRIIQACINYHKTKDSWNLESAIQYIFKREKGELFGPLFGLLYQIQIESFTSINQCQKSSFRQQKIKPSETRVPSNKESMLLQANNFSRSKRRENQQTNSFYELS